MNPRRLLASLLSLLALAATALAVDPPKRPNIVIILADDLGWADLGCYGADLIESPHIDHLAAQGVRFTNAYAMPVCSPSRATLLTGKHAARLHITIWAEGSRDAPGKRKLIQADSLFSLPHSETTLAKLLQDAGYLTALVGKWHLGDADYFPETHGFDVNIGGTHWGAPQTFYWPYRGIGLYGSEEFRYVPHLEFGHPGEYLTDRLTDEALRVIDHAGNQPFFLYLAHHAPHTPIEAKADDVKYFQERLRPEMHHQNPHYAAMVKSLDESVGRVLAHLQERHLDQNTIVIFASDNGGYIGTDHRNPERKMAVTNNFPLRSGKGSLYEGGVRVPLIVHWPGVTPNGLVSDEPVVLTDLFPTLVHAAGLPPFAKAEDGKDLGPLLSGATPTLDRDALYWHYPHYYETTTPVGSIRARDWKLLEYFEDNRVELYNLHDDPTEAKDLAAAQPERAAELLQKLHDWRASVGAAMPKPNPGYVPKKPAK